MKPPRFTDNHRFPHGYTPAAATDITKTFARARQEIEATKAKQQEQHAILTIKPRRTA
jgi:hypothetical protein